MKMRDDYRWLVHGEGSADEWQVNMTDTVVSMAVIEWRWNDG